MRWRIATLTLPSGHYEFHNRTTGTGTELANFPGQQILLRSRHAQYLAAPRQPAHMPRKIARLAINHRHRLEHAVAVVQTAILGSHAVADDSVHQSLHCAAVTIALISPRAFALCFLEFPVRLGIRDDAGTRAEYKPAATTNQRAYKDVEVEAAIAIQVTHRAGVRPPGRGFQFGDNLHATHLRATRNRPARKYRTNRLTGGDRFAHAPLHIGDDVMHMCISFYHHHFIDLDSTGHTNATQIIALEIDKHDMFGTLFRMPDEFQRQRPVLHGMRTARTRTGYRAGLGPALLQFAADAPGTSLRLTSHPTRPDRKMAPGCCA